MTARASNRSSWMQWGAVLFSAVAFLAAIFDYFWTGNGIHGTEGALLVVVSTLLMIIAVFLMVTHIVRGGFRILLATLLILDFIGTGFAAYLLEAWILLTLNVLAALAWLATLSTARAPPNAS